MALPNSKKPHLVRVATLGKSPDDFAQISPFFRKRYVGFQFDRHFYHPKEPEEVTVVKEWPNH